MHNVLGARVQPAPPHRIVQVYGVRVDCEWELDCALPASGNAEIRIRHVPADAIPQLQHLPALRPYETSPLSYTPLSDGGALVSWDGLYRFVVSSDGSDILGHADAALAPDALRAHLFGSVVSFALLRLGQEPLHGSALVLDGAAIALLGDSGAGKSTLAAALIAGGARLLSDDLLAIHYTDDVPIAQPGLQRLKLMPDAAARWARAAAGAPFHPNSPKRLFHLEAARFSTVPAPLRCCFVLQRGADAPACTRLTVAEAMHQLAVNTFNTLDARPARLRNHLALSARLAERVAVFRLDVLDDLDQIDSAAQLVRATLESILRSNRP